MPLRLYDSLTREIQTLAPGQPDGVFRFYNCGPTVYDAVHLGNLRTVVVNDVIRRLLELDFGAERVRHVRNITDVDDKTIRRSREEGRPLAEVTRHWTEKFHADCAALNCLPPHVEPTATGHIEEQIAMIATLVREGHAYRAEDGSVYFKVSSFAEYGRLSRVKERELKVGSALSAASADADEKEDLSDFALWKAQKPEDGPNAWPSPWGPGRPGWHIECSAMCKKHLGDTLDLHTGGVDLLFPHHENEIAQSECSNHRPLSRIWYHGEFLLVDGQKMSKRLGNMHTLDAVMGKGFSPGAVRYALLGGHPRKQLNFTFDSVHAAESALKKLRALADKVILAAGKSVADFYDRDEILRRRDDPKLTSHGLDALREDLNFPAALGELFTEKNLPLGENPTLALLDFYSLARVVYAFGLALHPEERKPEIPADVAAIAEKRWTARNAKDWATADRVRKELIAAGWSMKDGRDGYTLEPLKKA